MRLLQSRRVNDRGACGVWDVGVGVFVKYALEECGVEVLEVQGERKFEWCEVRFDVVL